MRATAVCFCIFASVCLGASATECNKATGDCDSDTDQVLLQVHGIKTITPMMHEEGVDNSDTVISDFSDEATSGSNAPEASVTPSFGNLPGNLLEAQANKNQKPYILTTGSWPWKFPADGDGCKKWCWSHPSPWSQKCTWKKNCGACEKQIGNHFHKAFPCRTQNWCGNWCENLKLDWCVKCSWPQTCRGCSQCQSTELECRVQVIGLELPSIMDPATYFIHQGGNPNYPKSKVAEVSVKNTITFGELTKEFKRVNKSVEKLYPIPLNMHTENDTVRLKMTLKEYGFWPSRQRNEVDVQVAGVPTMFSFSW